MSDNLSVLFKNVTLGHGDVPISECELALECDDGHHRLYVLKEQSGFYAQALEFSSCSGDHKGSIWDCDQLEVDLLFSATAYFDGVRHLEFNRGGGELAGYIYCPSMQSIIDMMIKIREIELEFCDMDR